MSILETIHLPCGGQASFNHSAGYGYVCEDCLCVVGSMSQPSECVEASEKYKVLKILGGNVTWDYAQGREVV